jgi:lactate 2-monooxygenase
MGEDGVRHVMKSLLADLDILMGVAGFNSVADFEKEILGEFVSTSETIPWANGFTESGPKSYSLIPGKVL